MPANKNWRVTWQDIGSPAQYLNSSSKLRSGIRVRDKPFDGGDTYYVTLSVCKGAAWRGAWTGFLVRQHLPTYRSKKGSLFSGAQGGWAHWADFKVAHEHSNIVVVMVMITEYTQSGIGIYLAFCSMQMLTDWSRTRFLNVVFISNIITSHVETCETVYLFVFRICRIFVCSTIV